MKVAIVTIIDMINYGNRLQNYAMQEVLKEMGEEVDTLIVQSAKRSAITFLKKTLLMLCPELMYKVRPYTKREKPFDDFSKKWIKQRVIYSLNGKTPKKLAKEYDYFVLGSDQVWNPEFMELNVPNGGVYNRFLKFAEKNQKIAVSPSFGVSTIDKKWENIYRENLIEFQGLSAREEAGGKIIEKLTGRRAEILLDPTMMISAERWSEFASKPNVDTNRPYLLKYILGYQSDVYKEKICDIAKKNGLVIYELMSDDMQELLTATPDQFVYLVEHAKLVCTDSFHATVFSILFNRPFLLHKREDGLAVMNSRLETLLNTLGLNDCLYTETTEISERSYDEAHRIIESEKEHFVEYIRNSVKEGKKDG